MWVLLIFPTWPRSIEVYGTHEKRQQLTQKKRKKKKKNDKKLRWIERNKLGRERNWWDAASINLTNWTYSVRVFASCVELSCVLAFAVVKYTFCHFSSNIRINLKHIITYLSPFSECQPNILCILLRFINIT